MSKIPYFTFNRFSFFPHGLSNINKKINVDIPCARSKVTLATQDAITAPIVSGYTYPIKYCKFINHPNNIPERNPYKYKSPRCLNIPVR